MRLEGLVTLTRRNDSGASLLKTICSVTLECVTLYDCHVAIIDQLPPVLGEPVKMWKWQAAFLWLCDYQFGRSPKHATSRNRDF